MRELSPGELEGLGDRFSVDIGETRAARLTPQVNEMLAELDRLEDIPVPPQDPDAAGGDRRWNRPTDDPHNTTVVECHVPPAADGALSGTTVGVKDIVAVAGVPMRCGSAVMGGYVPATDATVVTRLRRAGASITAKTNLDEFAGSGRGTTGVGSPVTNPHDGDRTAGGSSGGSAAAVAADRVDTALGTDTGGSVRIPAAFCGVVGLKPTYGLVPLTGIVENTYTQDHVGTFTRNVTDAAKLLAAMAGADGDDEASLVAAGREDYRVGGYVDASAEPPAVNDLSIGVLQQGFGDGVSERVTERTKASIDQLADAGATVSSVDIERFHDGRPIKNALSFVELATHWRDGAVPYRRGGTDEIYQTGFARARAAGSSELNDFYMTKLLAGAQVVDAHDGRHYVRAQAARERLRDEFLAALADLDVLVLPTMPDVAPRVESVAGWSYDLARNTRCANVTRLPAVTLPDRTQEGELPVGLQLVGHPFAEAELLAAAARVETLL